MTTTGLTNTANPRPRNLYSETPAPPPPRWRSPAHIPGSYQQIGLEHDDHRLFPSSNTNLDAYHIVGVKLKALSPRGDMLRNQGGRPRRQPKREPSLAPLRPHPGLVPGPRPGPGLGPGLGLGPGPGPPLPPPRPAPANPFLNHQAAAAPQLRDTSSSLSQDLQGSYNQALGGPGGGVLFVEPVRDVDISILTDRGIITAPIATFDKSYPFNFIDRRTVELYNLAHGPCQGKAEWRRTRQGAKFCFREAVFPFMLPTFYPLELSHTPKQVRMHIIEDALGPLIHFGELFQNDMEMGVYGDNHIHPYMLSPPLPDLAPHQFMPQAFPGSFYVTSQSVSRNIQGTARPFGVTGPPRTTPTFSPYQHNPLAADPQYEDWDIDQEM